MTAKATDKQRAYLRRLLTQAFALRCERLGFDTTHYANNPRLTMLEASESISKLLGWIAEAKTKRHQEG